MAFHIPEARPQHLRSQIRITEQSTRVDPWVASPSSSLDPSQGVKGAEAPRESEVKEGEGKASTSDEEQGVASRFEVVIPLRTPLHNPSPLPPSPSINTGGAMRGTHQPGGLGGLGSINARLSRAFLSSRDGSIPQDTPSSLSSSPLPTDDLLSVLAAQVAQSMEAKGKGSSAPPLSEIALVIKEVVRRVMAGEPAATVEVRLTLLGSINDNAPLLVELPPSPLAEPEEVTTVMYKRIKGDKIKTDPLSGLYLGSFGPHGPELLRLDRTMVDGEEVVEVGNNTKYFTI